MLRTGQGGHRQSLCDGAGGAGGLVGGGLRKARIGWISDRDVFLEPTVSYQVAQQVAGGECLVVSEQTLRHRLRARGLLASIDIGRQMLLVRRMVEGCQRQLLHLRSSDLAL